jgi:uncharacterized protein (DUF952 family)
MNSPNTVLRLASTAELEPAANAGEYAGIPALDRGFIHLSTPAQGRLLHLSSLLDTFKAAPGHLQFRTRC